MDEINHSHQTVQVLEVLDWINSEWSICRLDRPPTSSFPLLSDILNTILKFQVRAPPPMFCERTSFSLIYSLSKLLRLRPRRPRSSPGLRPPNLSQTLLNIDLHPIPRSHIHPTLPIRPISGIFPHSPTLPGLRMIRRHIKIPNHQHRATNSQRLTTSKSSNILFSSRRIDHPAEAAFCWRLGTRSRVNVEIYG